MRHLAALGVALVSIALSAEPAAPPGAVEGRIAFTRTWHGLVEAGEIYVVEADGTHERNLTRNPADDFGPTWSPDGGRIVFASYRCRRTADSCDSTLWVMNADASGQRRLTRGPGDITPAWSPDGKRIAFVRKVRANAQIFVVNADGTGARRLTHTSGDELFPSWSPDCQRIAFNHHPSGRDDLSAVYVMNADGSGRRRITPRRYTWGAEWSPDGSRIAFSAGDEQDVYVVRPDGSGRRRLVRHGSGPNWSPDGRTIVFTRGPALYLIAVGGSQLRRIVPKSGDPPVSEAGERVEPSWSR